MKEPKHKQANKQKSKKTVRIFPVKVFILIIVLNNNNSSLSLERLSLNLSAELFDTIGRCLRWKYLDDCRHTNN